MTTERLESALKLVAAGYRVFPVHGVNDRGECTCGKKSCGSIGKHPVFKGWQSEATTDQEKIKSWWRSRPDYNPAIATGNGLLVLDVDGETGKKGLNDLEAKYGPLPGTRTVITGGGGIHYYFHVSQRFSNSIRSLGAGLDTRADGGLVVAPGAKHRSGKLYDWDILFGPDEIEEAEAPKWLLDLLNAPEPKQEPQPYTPGDMIPEGQRNDTLFKHGCFLRGQQGMSMKEISKILHKLAAENCVPPYPPEEVDIIIDRVDRYRRAGGTVAFQPTGLIKASEVAEEEARFVIKPYIPEGQLTMIQGNPGDGKTAFACKLAALVSSGDDLLGLPVSSGPVLMLSVEDDMPVLRGRIQASGGDLDSCYFVENNSGLTFLSAEIEQYILDTQARLVIFDPLQAFLGAKVDMHKANETRPVLAALKEVAQRNHCAIVIISHLNKGLKDDAAILRSLGSIDIPGACRSVLHIGRRARDPNKRLMLQVKSSAAKEGQSIIFSIGEHGKVEMEAFTTEGYSDLSTAGKKARQAAEDPFLCAAVTEACKKILTEHPTGAKVSYEELGIAWPGNARPKTILDALTENLWREGIEIRTGERIKNGRNGILIAPAIGL